MTSLRLIGPGRAGRSLAAALVDSGCDLRGVVARGDDLATAAHGVDVLVIATPDAAVAEVAAAVTPVDGTVVLHLSGALGLDVLSPHRRRASLHPLTPLPSAEVGRVRLRGGITFAVAGDPLAATLGRLLGGRCIEIDDEHRAAYHAAACIAANHLVALLGQVERVAAPTGVGIDAFVALAAAALADVADLGPAAALTGPAARGDEATLDRHRAALAPEEIAGYDAGVALARRLAHDASSPAAPESGDGPVRVIHSARAFSDALEAERALGRRVGLVPTMGALHAGHRSLIERAAAECDVVAVTVFVNPLQFTVAEDLAAYPRDLDGDVDQAAGAGAGIVFAPPVTEMYPGFPAPVATSVHVDVLGDVLEGASRPGHFDGVATVVAKLCALAGRARVYFGEKDFQQLAVVRRMVVDLSLPVEIVPCPTVREAGGLALSSRNVRLDAEDRRAAVALHRALEAGRAAVDAGNRDPAAVGQTMRAVLGSTPGVDPDYAVAVDAATLDGARPLAGEIRLLVAATVGPVRLIDNIGMVVAADRRRSRSSSATPVGAPS